MDPACGLALVDMTRSQDWIWSQALVEQIVVAVGRIHVQLPGGVSGDGVTACRGGEMVDRIATATKCLSGNPKILLLPQVDSRLVTNLDDDIEIGEQLGCAPNDDILGLPR
jgi:hypothetical protein